jgi:hypothetical protein
MTGNQSGEGGGGDYQEAFKIKPAGHAAGYLVGFGGFSPPSPQTKPNFLTNPKSSIGVKHKVRIYKEYYGAHSLAVEALGESQFRLLEKKLNTLPTLWGKGTMFPKILWIQISTVAAYLMRKSPIGHQIGVPKILWIQISIFVPFLMVKSPIGVKEPFFLKYC